MGLGLPAGWGSTQRCGRMGNLATAHAGRVAVITGACGGIGNAIARRLQAEGARVSVLDTANWPPGEGQQTDVSDEGAVEAAFGAITAREGAVDYLVCCAGIFPARPFLQLTPEDWGRTLAVNLTGAFLCCRAALRSMRPRAFGRIVLFASMLARGGGVNCASYAASKGGVLGLARSLALEVATENIRVNTVTPGITDTAMPRGHMSEEKLSATGASNPLGRIGRIEDMVEACLFLLGEESSYMTGQDLRVNGGGALW